MDKNTKRQFNIKFKILVIVFILTIIILSGYLIYEKVNWKVNKDIYENINGTTNIDKVIALQQENTDVKGWIQIDDTIINYPILQTTNNEYYLNHNYKRKNSKYGSIFLKDKCDLLNNNSNLIIYGHNMKDEQMFNTLLKYENKNFYDNHKTIKIATNNEESEYSIIAVFKSRVFYQDEKNVFRYYNYINFDDEQTYDEYIINCKKIQLYDTGISAKYGEQLITLITCEYSQDNGRMVVVAKKES